MLVDTDWVECWRSLLAACARQTGEARRDFWDRRAPGFALASSQDRSTEFVAFLEPWLKPDRTLIDVGAGIGRLSAPLAERLRWVKAVEPSQGMQQRIPSKPNLTVIPSSWETAEAGQADLVICVHVLYSVKDPVRFIEKLEAAATEHIFIVMRDSLHTHPAVHLTGPGRARPPQLRECFMLLRQIGVAPDMTMFTHPTRYYFANVEDAVQECRLSLGPGFDETAARGWLMENLEPRTDGVLVYDGGLVTSGVLHWNPRHAGSPHSFRLPCST